MSVASTASAEVQYLTQQRVIEATTSFDMVMLMASAPDFSPFTQTVDRTVDFPTPQGTTDTNRGRSTISCTLDTNAVRLSGSLTGSGGLAVNSVPVSGEAASLVFVEFTVSQPTPFRLTALPRPIAQPDDEFQIELENVATGARLFFLDATTAPTAVDVSGVLEPGTYSFQYQVELTVLGDELIADYGAELLIPAPSSAIALLALAPALRRRR